MGGIIALQFAGLDSKTTTTATMALGIFLAVWWLIATVVLTESVFISLGNGYFSTYLALIGSLYLLPQCQVRQQLANLLGSTSGGGGGGGETDPPESDVAYNAYENLDDDVEGGTDF